MKLVSMIVWSVEKLDEMLLSTHFIFQVVLCKHQDAQTTSQYSMDTHDLWNRQKVHIIGMVPTIRHKIQPPRMSKKIRRLTMYRRKLTSIIHNISVRTRSAQW